MNKEELLAEAQKRGLDVPQMVPSVDLSQKLEAVKEARRRGIQDAIPLSYEQHFKDTMTPDEFAIALTEGETPAPEYEQRYNKPQSAAIGAGQGATFGTADEMAAGVTGLMQMVKEGGLRVPTNIQEAVNALGTVMGTKNAYSGEMEQQKQAIQAAQENPLSYLGGEVAGAVGQGIGAVKSAPTLAKGIASYASRGLPQATATGAGIGAIQGGLYGAGTGDGDRTERAISGAGYGGLGGVAGAGLGAIAKKGSNVIKKSLTQRAQEKFAPKSLQEVAEQVTEEVLPEFGNEAKAVSKIEKAIRKDYGKDADAVIEAWKSTDEALIEGMGTKQRQLAQGAAQYAGGKEGAEKFLYGKIEEVPDVIRNAIKENITGDVNYHATVDDILKSGRKKASPLYKQSAGVLIEDNGILTMPEIQQTLKSVYKKYPTQLKEYAPNSIKALDLAKRELDDVIDEAKRSGQKNLAQSRRDIKKQLTEVMDAASPMYAKARKESGDYLSITQAMDDGRKFMKSDPELALKQFKKLSPNEQVAFKSGMGKALRDVVDNNIDNRNPFNKILGTPKKKKLLKSILSDDEYTNFSKDLFSVKRLFSLSNEVLGGSNTSGKQIAREEIAGLSADIASGGVTAVPRQGLKMIVKKMTDGINDKTAKQISDILYETRPTEKLKIIEQMRKATLPKVEKEIALKTYFEAQSVIDDVIRSSSDVGASAGGALAQPKPLEIEVRPQGK